MSYSHNLMSRHLLSTPFPVLSKALFWICAFEECVSINVERRKSLRNIIILSIEWTGNWKGLLEKVRTSLAGIGGVLTALSDCSTTFILYPRLKPRKGGRRSI